MKLLHVFLLVLAAAFASAPVYSQSADEMQILRDKVKADKKLLVSQNMLLSDSEAKAFWPIYDAYQADLAKINERLGKAIVAYADAYNAGPVSNDTAKKLMNEYFAIEDEELKLQRSYAAKLEKVLPSAKVARYLQIENKIRSVLKYELAAKIPLVL
jgi:hypothetical protein